jgi:hypothetical protein
MSRVLMYGIASTISRDIAETRLTREEAEELLAEVLEDEPDLAGVLYVAEIELPSSPN